MINKIIRNKLLLLLFPILLLAATLGFLGGGKIDIFVLLGLMVAVIINITPYIVLLIIHYYRTKGKTGAINYSFYTAFSLSLVVMVIVNFLIIREVSLGRPGSQLAAGIGFYYLPWLTIPVMLFGYMVGCMVEWFIRRGNNVYVAEDALKRKAFRTHVSKYKILYIIIILILVIMTNLKFLYSEGVIPLPDIHLAAELGSIRQVKHFLDKGVDINAANENGKTPLHLAIFSGKKSIIEFLITNGASVNAKDNSGTTPLHTAAYGNDVEIIGILLNHGADINVQDNYGDTPLREAARRGCTNAVEYLIKNGANVNIKNKLNQTAIFEAVWYGHKDIVEILLSGGAEIDYRDIKGRSPLSVSVEKKYKNIEDMLRNHMKGSAK